MERIAEELKDEPTQSSSSTASSGMEDFMSAGDTANNTASDVLDDNANENKDEDLNLGDTSNFSTEERNALFQRGLEYEKNKKLNAALQCYLGCMQGLKNKTLFVLLPQCLHNIADIYRQQENYERAIHFAQAEKLFYETSLIESDEIQRKLEEVAADEGGDRPRDLNELNIDALRAEEYEHLAKLCLDRQQHQLALEYAGKCTKLRQQVYGENHEKTKASLNFFAALYAEVGRLQYSDSINRLTDASPEGRDNEQGLTTAETMDKTPEVMSTSVKREPVSILRQRSEDGLNEADREKKQVRFHKSVEESIRHKEKEELASLTVTLILLAMCVLILASMGMWLYCSLDRGQTCQEMMAQLKTWARTIQYHFYQLTRMLPPS